MAKKKDETRLQGDIEIGRRLRDARQALAMSQTRLGAAIGVTREMIRKFEAGLSTVNAYQAKDLAGVLQVTPAWLLYGETKEEICTTPLQRLAKAVEAQAQTQNRPEIVERCIGFMQALIVELTILLSAVGAAGVQPEQKIPQNVQGEVDITLRHGRKRRRWSTKNRSNSTASKEAAAG